MQVTETASEGLKREFTITLPSADIERRIEDRLQEVGHSVTIPGFRPGKVPLSLLKTRFGTAVRGEVIESAVADSSAQAMADHGIRPAMRPEIELTAADEGIDLEYKMAVEILPDIEPMDFSTLELERLDAEVPESEVDEAMSRLATQHRRAEPITEDRKSESGDILVIDYVGKVDGKEFPGGKAEAQYVELGAGTFIPGFEDQLMGHSAGAQTTVDVTFPEDYPNAELAGKDASFQVEVKEIRSSVALAVDDSLATTLGHENLDALKVSVHEQLAANYASVSRARLKRELFDKLSEHHDFPVPPGMLELEFKNIWEQVQRDKEAGNVDPSDVDKTDEELQSEYREIAERRIRLGLLLSEIGHRNNISLTDEERSRAVIQEVQRFPGREQQVYEFYRDNPAASESLSAPIFEDKVVDFIIEMAQVGSRNVAPDELIGITAADPETDPKPAKKKRSTAKKPRKTATKTSEQDED